MSHSKVINPESFLTDLPLASFQLFGDRESMNTRCKWIVQFFQRPSFCTLSKGRTDILHEFMTDPVVVIEVSISRNAFRARHIQ